MFNFVLAHVSYPILGLDFFNAHKLLIDAKTSTILFKSNMLPVTFPSKVVAATAVTVLPSVYQLLDKFPVVCSTGTST
jgi:hypothetical protein